MDERHIGFSRFIYALELLNHYDFVVWIDGDSIITNDNYSIHDFITDESNFFFSYDWMTNPQHSSTLSSGNFILRSDQNIEFLAENFLHIAQYYLNNVLQEQGTLSHMFSLPEFSNYFKILPQKYLNSVPTCVYESEKWKDPNRPPIFHLAEWNQDSFLAHLTGVPNKERVNMIQNNFKKYTIY
jgi:hypothetical protein